MEVLMKDKVRGSIPRNGSTVLKLNRERVGKQEFSVEGGFGNRGVSKERQRREIPRNGSELQLRLLPWLKVN